MIVNNTDSFFVVIAFLFLFICCAPAVLLAAEDSNCGQWGYAQMDLNRDCYVNLEDFAMFCSQWLTCSNPLDGSCEKLNKALVVAHRGYSGIAPENTIAAFDAAAGYADLVEFDVRSSADNVLVLMHDSTVDRTTDANGALSSFTLAELKALDAGSWFSSEFAGEQIPTLQEAIEAILPDMTPCIERKAGTAQQYVDLLEAMDAVDDVVIISFNRAFLLDVRELNSDVKLGFLETGDANDTIIVDLKTDSIDFLDWRYYNLTADNIERAKSIGLGVYIWTVDSQATMESYIDMGVDGITTNLPELARTVVDQD